MNNLIFDKTNKGREEIAKRTMRLDQRLRTLLVMVDGKKDVQQLFQQLAKLGFDEGAINRLLDDGLIQQVPEKDAVAAPAVAAPAVAAPNEAEVPGHSQPVRDAASTAHTHSVGSMSNLQENGTQFQALYQFFNQTIRSTIGLRGFGLQLKVERAMTIQDFRDLRQPYLEAVFKAKGQTVANNLRAQLDRLLTLDKSSLSTNEHNG